MVEQSQSYYKRDTVTLRNVASIFPEDYIFERLGERERAYEDTLFALDVLSIRPRLT
jgi:hypothetical protein